MTLAVGGTLNTTQQQQRKLYFSKDPEAGGGGGGPTFSRGKMHITCDFSGGGGVQTPYPPSGSAHGHVRRYRHLRICNEYRLIQTMVAAHKLLITFICLP